jgi:hypothetical protein
MSDQIFYAEFRCWLRYLPISIYIIKIGSCYQSGLKPEPTERHTTNRVLKNDFDEPTMSPRAVRRGGRGAILMSLKWFVRRGEPLTMTNSAFFNTLLISRGIFIVFSNLQLTALFAETVSSRRMNKKTLQLQWKEIKILVVQQNTELCCNNYLKFFMLWNSSGNRMK